MDNKVLIVDDQEGIRMLLEETCLLLGYDVITASSGDEALQVAVNNRIKAAIIDMKMPGLNGIETLRRLHALNPEIDVVLMTGYGETFLVDDALKEGANGIIHKPFDLVKIKEFLEDSFRRQRK